MKLIHTADIHLGSRMEAKLTTEQARERRGELRQTFTRMVAYAEKEGIHHILFSGDIFDTASPSQKDKKYFYSLIKGNPDISFYYLLGNHDQGSSYTEDQIDNLFTFSTEWTSYDLGEVVVTGIEMVKENERSLYTTLSLDPTRTNLVMLHGDIYGGGKGSDAIQLKSLANKHIDYLALGHIHAHDIGKVDERGTWCYPGCLEGRSYDEIGEKGFVVLDTEDGLVPHFVPFGTRTVREMKVDITPYDNLYDIEKALRADLAPYVRDMVRVYLTGTTDLSCADLAIDIERDLKGVCYHLSVKNQARKRIHPEEYEGDISLRGEFFRAVQASALSEEEKAQVLELGLQALDTGRIDE